MVYDINSFLLFLLSPSLSTIHANGDARTLFKLLELFLDYIRVSLKTDENATQGFVWGNEVGRLTPPGPLIPSIVESGRPPSIALDAAPQSADAVAPAPVSICFEFVVHHFNSCGLVP